MTKVDKGPVPKLAPLRERVIMPMPATTQPRQTPIPTQRSALVPAPLEQPLPRGAMPIGYPTPRGG